LIFDWIIKIIIEKKKGPFLRYWWYALDLKVFSNANSFLRPVKMMLLDQATTPYIMNGLFLYYLSKTNGDSNQDSIGNVKKVKE